MSASALAATTHNERRTADDVSEFDLASRSAPLMHFAKRQDQRVQDAFKEMKAAAKAAKAAIPEAEKTKVDEAKKNLKAAKEAAQAKIPEEEKNKVEEAKKGVQAAKDAADAAIPEDLKKQLDDKKKAFKEAKGQDASQGAPAPPASTEAPKL